MAKGSQKTYGGWEVRQCRTCGRKLTLKTPAVYHFDPVPWSECADCVHARARHVA